MDMGMWAALVLAVLILIAVIVPLVMAAQEHERLRDPYVASFVHEVPGTWRWHWMRFKLRFTGGIPPRS